MVRAHDERALDLFLLHRLTASHADWDTTHEAMVWARALGLTTPQDTGAAAVSKVWVKLDRKYRLVERERRGRLATVTSLLEDGSGDPYIPPKGVGDSYIRLPFAYWADGWYRTLRLPGKAVLLIALSLSRKPAFKLPTERAPKWYGISADTAERGLRELQDRKLLSRGHSLREDWLSGTVTTREYHYSVLDPFLPPAALKSVAP
ncbi:hypothetical protein [Kribbella catacumbae]|uniref:hypothetical protein n=1 Tax=Kribbella catacumbae TaxID=460086 RepID=UPI0012F7F3D7|nr:hypothetical protein [Kribbella catacumbae]